MRDEEARFYLLGKSSNSKVFLDAMKLYPIGGVIQDSVNSKAFYRLFKKHSEVPIANFEPSVNKTVYKAALYYCLLVSPMLGPCAARAKYGKHKSKEYSLIAVWKYSQTMFAIWSSGCQVIHISYAARQDQFRSSCTCTRSRGKDTKCCR
jgi:hypothetical protein